MGGALLVAIRHTMNGAPEEVIMYRWTNDFSWRFMMPSFQNQGKELQDYCTELLKGDSDWCKHVDHIYPSEYGYVLIDFPSRHILSRQGYCKVGRCYVTTTSTAFDDTAVGLTEMALKNKLDIYRGFNVRDADKVSPEDFVEAMANAHEAMRKECKDPNKPEFWDPKNRQHTQESFIVELKPDLWTMDHGDKHDGIVKEAKAWVKARGWKAKVSAEE